MPESRDRISRQEDIATLFARRRQLVRETGILPDIERIETTTPRRTTIRTPAFTRRSVRVSGLMRGSGGFGRGSSRFGPPMTGQENTPITVAATAANGRRGRTNVLPSWYPRTPLRDITAVTRAIERRRVADAERQPLTDAQLEHDLSMITPAPGARAKVFTPSSNQVLKIFVDKTNQIEVEGSEFITPQKKLLNSIDTVGKVMMEELRKQQRTPTAKKAEREKIVRTLMSMR